MNLCNIHIISGSLCLSALNFTYAFWPHPTVISNMPLLEGLTIGLPPVSDQDLDISSTQWSLLLISSGGLRTSNPWQKFTDSDELIPQGVHYRVNINKITITLHYLKYSNSRMKFLHHIVHECQNSFSQSTVHILWISFTTYKCPDNAWAVVLSLWYKVRLVQ